MSIARDLATWLEAEQLPDVHLPMSGMRTTDPTVAAMAAEASRRLKPDPPKPRSPASGRSGVLDASYAAQAPAGQGCEWLTRQGKPCQNPANYRVDGKWSCSRDHRP